MGPLPMVSREEHRLATTTSMSACAPVEAGTRLFRARSKVETPKIRHVSVKKYTIHRYKLIVYRKVISVLFLRYKYITLMFILLQLEEYIRKIYILEFLKSKSRKIILHLFHTLSHSRVT